MMRCCMGLMVVGALLSPAAPARACEPAHLTGDLDRLPESWRRELEALVAATRDANQPWGCSGARVALRLDQGDAGATLRVDRRGARRMERHLASPLDVVPMGKALLAQPVAPPPPPEPDPDLPQLLEAMQGDAAATEDRAPRALVDATATVRYLGNSHLLVAGAGIRGTLPIDDFQVALAARYAELVNALGYPDGNPGLSTLAVSGIFGYQVVDAPVRLTLGLSGTVALLSVEVEGDDRVVEVERSAVDGRFGTEARLAVPLVSIVDFLVALDAELAPGSLNRSLHPLLPPVPAYVVGVNTGLGVRIP